MCRKKLWFSTFTWAKNRHCWLILGSFANPRVMITWYSRTSYFDLFPLILSIAELMVEFIQVLELGMNFLAADDMSAILAVKLRKRLGFGMWTKLHLTGMQVEGKVITPFFYFIWMCDFCKLNTYLFVCFCSEKVLVGVKFLRRWPFLGRLRVCFAEPPYFQMTVKPIFTHGLDVAVLPGIAGWLVSSLNKIF